MDHDAVLGVLLMPHKQRRVLDGELIAALERAGARALLLDPAEPSGWARADAILHKVPTDPGLLCRLERFAAEHPRVALLDPPAAVRRASRRDEMLAPLRARSGLLLELSAPEPDARNSSDLPAKAAAGALECGRVSVCAPPEAVLHAGMSPADAADALRAAGVGYPCLIKPRGTAPLAAQAGAAAADDAEPGAAAAAGPGAARDASPCAPPARGPPAGGREANHAMAALLSGEGLAPLLSGRAGPALRPPVVAQQFIPHGERLLKVYVIGGHVITQERGTLTLVQLDVLAAQQAASQALPNSSGGGGGGGGTGPGLLLLSGRASAEPRGGGAGAPAVRPPEWALRQLAAKLGAALGLSLFNFDLIVPSGAPRCDAERGRAGPPAERQAQAGREEGPLQLIVIDVNFFPGFDKVPGAQQLLGRYLAGAARAAAAARRGEGSACAPDEGRAGRSRQPALG